MKGDGNDGNDGNDGDDGDSQSNTKIALRIKKVTICPRVITLINMIYDLTIYNKVAKEFSLDHVKAPLGAISKQQILKATLILNQLNKIISNEDSENEV